VCVCVCVYRYEYVSLSALASEPQTNVVLVLVPVLQKLQLNSDECLPAKLNTPIIIVVVVSYSVLA
jgi:hypothetical protein